MILQYPLCTVLICQYTTELRISHSLCFLIQSRRNHVMGGEVRRTSIHMKKSSNLRDDKNDFPYELFLIQLTFIFHWYKMLIYLFVNVSMPKSCIYHLSPLHVSFSYRYAVSLFFITAMFFSSRCINVLQFCSIIFN